MMLLWVLGQVLGWMLDTALHEAYGRISCGVNCMFAAIMLTC
jgi:hypothetical protein